MSFVLSLTVFKKKKEKRKKRRDPYQPLFQLFQPPFHQSILRLAVGLFLFVFFFECEFWNREGEEKKKKSTQKTTKKQAKKKISSIEIEKRKEKKINAHASLGRAIGAVEDVDGCAAVITSAACAEESIPANRTRARRRSDEIEIDFILRFEKRGRLFFLVFGFC